MPEARDLTDGELQSEIELVGDLVVAATSSEGPLPQKEIDRLLGLKTGEEPATDVEEPAPEGSEQPAADGSEQPAPEADV